MIHNCRKQHAKGINLCSGHVLKRTVSTHKHLSETQKSVSIKVHVVQSGQSCSVGTHHHFFFKGTQWVSGLGVALLLFQYTHTHSRRKSQNFLKEMEVLVLEKHNSERVGEAGAVFH